MNKFRKGEYAYLKKYIPDMHYCDEWSDMKEPIIVTIGAKSNKKWEGGAFYEAKDVQGSGEERWVREDQLEKIPRVELVAALI